MGFSEGPYNVSLIRSDGGYARAGCAYGDRRAPLGCVVRIDGRRFGRWEELPAFLRPYPSGISCSASDAKR